MMIRKNVSVDKLFTASFTTAITSLVFARVFYVLMYPKGVFFNILGFIMFPYYPGLSLTGGFVGGVVFLILYARREKMPAGRLLDIVILSFASVLPLGFALTAFLLGSPSSIIFSSVATIVYAFVAFIFVKHIYPMVLRGMLKAGTLSFLFALSFCVISFLMNMFGSRGIQLVNEQNIVLLAVFCLCLVFVVKQELLGGNKSKK